MATRPITTDATRIITAPTNNRSLRLPTLALVNLLLAGGMFAVGLPGVLADFRGLPAMATVGAVDTAQPVGQADIDAVLPALESAAATSPAARGEFATLLMAGAGGPDAMQRLDRAAREFRAYLADVPGDSRAWTMLAEVEQRRGHVSAAQQALKTSILTAPWMPGLVLARCALGIDLYPVLDRETSHLVAEEFQIAAMRKPNWLVDLAQRKHAILTARIMLFDSPEAQARFEKALAQR